MDTSTRQMLRLIMLTGVRTFEAIGVRVEEVDLFADLWTFPGDRYKNEEPHTIPLSPSAKALFVEAIGKRKSGFVWPGRTRSKLDAGKEERPYDRQTIAHAIKRNFKHFGIGKFMAHDPRKTISTQLGEKGVADDLVERVLGHRWQGVAGIYNKSAMLELRRAEMDRWDDMLTRPDAEIVTLDGKTA